MFNVSKSILILKIVSKSPTLLNITGSYLKHTIHHIVMQYHFSLRFGSLYILITNCFIFAKVEFINSIP